MQPAQQRVRSPAATPVLGSIAKSILAIRWLKPHHKMVWLDLANLAADQGKSLPACVTTSTTAIATSIGEESTRKVQRWLKELAGLGVIVLRSYDGAHKCSEYTVAHPDEFNDAVVVRDDDQRELFDRFEPAPELPPADTAGDGDTIPIGGPAPTLARTPSDCPPKLATLIRGICAKGDSSPNLVPKMTGTPPAALYSRAGVDVFDVDVDVKSSDVGDHTETVWTETVAEAERLVAAVRRHKGHWDRPITSKDWDLVVKACYLARTRMPEAWLADCKAGLLRSKKSIKNPWAFLTVVIQNKCVEVAQARGDPSLVFATLFRSVVVPDPHASPNGRHRQRE